MTTDEPVAVHMTWTEYFAALHVAFLAGLGELERVRDERLADEADFAQMARRLRKAAGAPSHQELTTRRRRHQVDASQRVGADAAPWPQEVA